MTDFTFNRGEVFSRTICTASPATSTTTSYDVTLPPGRYVCGMVANVDVVTGSDLSVKVYPLVSSSTAGTKPLYLLKNGVVSAATEVTFANTCGYWIMTANGTLNSPGFSDVVLPYGARISVTNAATKQGAETFKLTFTAARI